MTTDNLDTRGKIVSSEGACVQLAEGNWLIVAGYFDPLTAAVAERVRDLVDKSREERVLAVVLHSSGTLLSAEARSHLVAALRTVDAVLVTSEEDSTRFIARDSRIRFVFDREAERRDSAEFAELVLSKERSLLHSTEPGS